MLAEDSADVVAEDVGVPDDGGVVHHLPDPVNHEHDVGDVREAVCRKRKMGRGLVV